MKLRYIVILFVLILTITPYLSIYADTYQAEVENISNRDYFGTTLNAIQNAKESIVMGMYLISVIPSRKDSDVYKLLDALVSARNRGVKVKVIIEYHSQLDFTSEGLAYYAYNYLKDNGVEVYFDESSNVCLHLKTIVIDKEIVITGSSNWSEAAFQTNYETNIILRSKPLSLSILKDLEEIPVRKGPLKKLENSFFIPSLFFSSRAGQLRRMVMVDDERALNVILILWCENKNLISCDFIAEKIGLTNKMDRTGWRRQIKRTLRKLDEKYGLIKYTWRHGKDDIKIELVSFPGENPVEFPKDYFRYDWNNRLSLSGKAVLLTMYSELKDAVSDFIKVAIRYLSKKYGMKVYTYSKGVQELKRFNIIKVQYGEYGKEFKDRDITKITVLGVYDMEEYDREIEELEVHYGEEFVTEVRAMAGIVYCAYDIGVIKDILKQIEFYGIGAVRRAFGYVKKMRIDNYKRTYGYVINILKRYGEKATPHPNPLRPTPRVGTPGRGKGD